MLKAAVAVLAAAIILLASVFVHPASAAAAVVAAAGKVPVTGSSGILDGQTYRVAGKIRNDTPDAIWNVRVTASMLDSFGNVVATVARNTFISVLRQGEMSPFAVVVEDARVSSRISSYRLDVAWNVAAATKPDTLKVTTGSSSGYYDNTGAYHLVGDITNTGLLGATDVIVAGAFLDSGGNLVGSDAVFTSPAKIGPGHTAPFHFVYSHATGSSQIASALLNVQSNEFSSITELEPGAAEPAASAKQVPQISMGLDLPSYRYGDRIKIEGRVSTVVAGESLVLLEFLYPDGSVFNSLQSPLFKGGNFASSYDISPGREHDNKTFTIRATYAGSNSTSTFAYLGRGDESSRPAPAENKEQHDARLTMSAVMSERTKIVTMSLKNPKGNDAQVYSRVVKMDKGVKSASGPSGWKAKIDGNGKTITFTADTKPVLAGKVGRFKVMPAGGAVAGSFFDWDALDKAGKEMAGGKPTQIKARK